MSSIHSFVRKTMLKNVKRNEHFTLFETWNTLFYKVSYNRRRQKYVVRSTLGGTYYFKGTSVVYVAMLNYR